jgi:hypothetical protein
LSAREIHGRIEGATAAYRGGRKVMQAAAGDTEKDLRLDELH